MMGASPLYTDAELQELRERDKRGKSHRPSPSPSILTLLHQLEKRFLALERENADLLRAVPTTDPLTGDVIWPSVHDNATVLRHHLAFAWLELDETEKKLAAQKRHVQRLTEGIQRHKKRHGEARDQLNREVRAMRHALQQYVPGDEPTIVRVGDLWVPTSDPSWYEGREPGTVIWLEKPQDAHRRAIADELTREAEELGMGYDVTEPTA